MRIIAGSKRGLKLISPSSNISRPILDRVKENLFNVIYKYDMPAGCVVADIFSGVGSMGLEALSRGAKYVCFVEMDSDIASTLEKNIKKAGFTQDSKIAKVNAFKAGAPVDNSRGKYDLVFVDPPYIMVKDVDEESKLARLMDVLPDQTSPNAIIAVRTPKRIDLLETYACFEFLDRRKWGNMAVTLFRKNDD